MECATTSSHDKRLGKMQLASDFTSKQTREFEIAIDVLQCCCHASHAFQFSHFGIDENLFESINVLQRKVL